MLVWGRGTTEGGKIDDKIEESFCLPKTNPIQHAGTLHLALYLIYILITQVSIPIIHHNHFSSFLKILYNTFFMYLHR